jgi:hypothetical protein
MHFELDRRLAPAELADLEDGVRAVLAQIARVVADFDGLRGGIDRMVELARAASTRYDADDVEDAEAFLRWLLDEHFVFLGYREYDIADGVWGVVEGSGLGLLKDCAQSNYAEGKPLSEMSEALRTRATEGELVVISRTNSESPIRRRERMDYIGVRRVNEAGEIVGEARLVGLFATRAYAEPASTIPLVARKIQRIVGAEDLIPGSHDFKAALRLFDSFPKNEVFGATTEDLRQEIVALLGLTGDQVRLLGRRGADGRTATLIAALPRRRYDAQLRRNLRALVAERFGVEKVEAHEVLGEEERVQYHLTVHSAAADLPEVDFAALEQELRELARTWDDVARDALVARHGEERGAVLAARWLERFPQAYRAATAADVAAGDVDGLEAMLETATDFGVGLQDDAGRTRVAVYKHGDKLELSQAMPMLEDLGLRVIEEHPTRLLDPEPRRRDLAAGVRRARPGGCAAGPGGLRRPRGGDAARGLERRDRDRLAASRSSSTRRASRACTCAAAGRPRRPALVRPARRLPHRGPRPDEGADGEERGDRAGRRQGRLLSQAPARRRRRRPPTASLAGAEGTACYRIFIRALLLDVTDNLVDGKVVHPPGRGRHDGDDPTSSSPPTRAPRRSPTSPTRSRGSAASGSATRSPPAARSATTTRRWASPPAAPGSRSSATSASSASTSRPRTSRSSASATCPATCSATACCCRSTSGWSPRSTTATSSSTPTPTRRKFAERKRLFELPRSSWDDYDRR